MAVTCGESGLRGIVDGCLVRGVEVAEADEVGDADDEAEDM